MKCLREVSEQENERTYARWILNLILSIAGKWINHQESKFVRLVGQNQNTNIARVNKSRLCTPRGQDRGIREEMTHL